MRGETLRESQNALRLGEDLCHASMYRVCWVWAWGRSIPHAQGEVCLALPGGARHGAALIGLQERLIRETPVVMECDDALYHTVCRCVLDLTELLKPEYREMLHRVELEEASLRETAATLGLTPNNAAVRLRRARRALRTALMHLCGTCAEYGCLDCTCRRHASPSPSA
jgi:hypothetical protein